MDKNASQLEIRHFWISKSALPLRTINKVLFARWAIESSHIMVGELSGNVSVT